MMHRLIQTAVLLIAIVPASQLSAQPVDSLRIMTFNVWSGEGTQAGRDKLREIMLAGGADIIGVQELDDSAGRSIAAAMGFHYYQQSGGDIQVISRYPIVAHSPANLGVNIALSPTQNVWLFNAHLAPYPYQPYDLQDGILPKNESAVIAAANAARGGQVTTYLNDMASVLGSGVPVFFTGDFNEPSFLDWTAEAASATPRPFDLKVEYPASKRIVDAGMTDSFRAVRPDEVGDTAYTWTPGYPYPIISSNEVHDRIDIIYHAGAGVTATSAFTVGPVDGNPNTHLSVAGYNADHRAVVVQYEISISGCSLFGDLNSDCSLDSADWSMFRTGQFRDMTGLTPAQAFTMGDLNGDFRNNHADFVIFKRAFESAHGADAFAALLARVPEPSTIFLTIVVVCTGLMIRRAGL
ncbi:MAG TPA: endonuclease/exonuclease/phosphatase family protein [Lacipirellulaceae bacterium]|jgi:endonuclease/exonuclease/phosphatase family metal-dependent hydrolase|nr:endonuclease/exonuclease/phosphatase family protein [Lacipirellulaceae bacterium]